MCTEFPLFLKDNLLIYDQYQCKRTVVINPTLYVPKIELARTSDQ